ncbi:MAG TPA: hypothetical protein VGI33_12710 [Paenibacillus sp.]|jgi:hypothetical protein
MFELDVDVDLILSELNVKSCDFVYVGGSFTTGFFNDSSDIDLFFIYGDNRPVDCHGHQLFINHRRIDIQNMTFRDWNILSEKIIQASGGPIETVTMKEVMAYYRTSIGMPLVERERFFFERGNKFSQTLLSSLLLKIYQRDMENLLIHLKAAIALNHLQKATEHIQQLIQIKMAIYCCGRGENYPNHKWRYEKLYRIHGKNHPIPGFYRSLEDRSSLLTSCSEVQNLLQELMEEESIVVLAEPVGFVVVLQSDTTFLEVDSECYLVKGNNAFEVCNGVLLNWKKSVQRSKTREIYLRREDAFLLSSLFEELEGYELININAIYDDLTEFIFVEQTERALVKKHRLNELIDRRIKGWMAWIDYQSFYDDHTGALKAGQMEASLIAARRMLLEVLKLWVSEKSGLFPDNNYAIYEGLRRYDSEEYVMTLRLLRSMPMEMEDINSISEMIHNTIAKYLSDSVPRIPGNIREHIPHEQLFEYGSKWLQLARSYLLPIPLTDEMIRKVDDVIAQKIGGHMITEEV